jgi:hypothetical protein
VTPAIERRSLGGFEPWPLDLGARAAGANPANEGDPRDVESGGYRGLGHGRQCFPHEVCDVSDKPHVE